GVAAMHKYDRLALAPDPHMEIIKLPHYVTSALTQKRSMLERLEAKRQAKGHEQGQPSALNAEELDQNQADKTAEYANDEVGQGERPTLGKAAAEVGGGEAGGEDQNHVHNDLLIVQ